MKNTDKGEKLETINCDNWMETTEDAIPKIFCVTNKKLIIGYPSTSLRKVTQNIMNVETKYIDNKDTDSSSGIYV